ncbi:MAG TPA: glycosyltransferase [Solirubrobacteraceae bacterium]|jgi:GT2 family glycosyltransferase/glycosyltransferase involved in cell wall biosynthesis|nr:glycosyltransferase [Solirubrobacteraceae bacterium]
MNELARLHDEIALRDRDIERCRAELKARDRELCTQEGELRRESGARAAAEAELAEARARSRRVEESVTWRLFERARGRLYGAIGERSLLARGVGEALRLLGRLLIRPASLQAPAAVAEEPAPVEPELPVIVLPAHPQPKISLVIPVGAHAGSAACLQMIARNTNRVGYEVVVVDDCADAETKHLLAGVRGLHLVANESDCGYLHSVGVGVGAARGEWIVLCDNDITVGDGWLKMMLECAESAPDVGVVTPKYVQPDGMLSEAGGIVWRNGTVANYGRGEDPTLFQFEYRRPTDCGSPGALMMRADLWRSAGGLDQHYITMCYGCADICFKAREQGLLVLYEPAATVMRAGGDGAGSGERAAREDDREFDRQAFVARWRQRLDREHRLDAPSNRRNAANRRDGPHVLVVDHRVPTPDQDAGSLRMSAIIRALLDLGARVTFLPDDFTPIQPYTRELQELGVEVFYGQLNMNAELATIGPRLTAAILSRPHPASRWLDTVRRYAPAATVAYDSVDLHWLREARRQALTVRPENRYDDSDLASLGGTAGALRHLELAMIGAADVTIVVSEAERNQVERDVSGTRTLLLPMIHDIEPAVAPAAGRSGVLFVGGFQHPPNVDAAIALVTEVMPAVWSQQQGVRVTIVGAHPPSEVQALASPLVEVVGWVDELAPLLSRSRVMAAPLRYGAGMKGKITQSLAMGLPVVTTSIGVEGLEGGDRGVLVADDPVAQAAEIIRVYGDDELWQELSRAGQDLIQSECSPRVALDRLRPLLDGGAEPAKQPGARAESNPMP